MKELKEQYLGITIDYGRNKLLTEQGLVLLEKQGFYKMDHETSPQQTFARAATAYCFGDYAFAQRLYDYVSQGWMMLASPVLTNAPVVNWPVFVESEWDAAREWFDNNVEMKALSISCYLSHSTDELKGLIEARSETAYLSAAGGGIGVYMGNRAPDNKSTGALSHMRGYDADALSFKQTSSRRGSIAAYLRIDHPEIKTFLEARNPVGGDPNKKCLNLHQGLSITDAFMLAVIRGEDCELVDPKHGATGEKLNAREVWEHIMQIRFETGEPYLLFVDTVNKNLPKQITNPMYRVVQSNLCCVGGETTILTDDGHKVIETLVGQKVNVWNGEQWSEVTVEQTGENRKLLLVTLTNGKELWATANHKWLVGARGQVVTTDNLVAGMSVPVITDSLGTKLVTIKSVEDHGRFDTTYCFNEPVLGRGVFNGILTKQSEITLYTSPSRTAVCCLSSLNVEYYDEWKDTQIVQDMIRLLDNVLETFILKGDPNKIPRALRSARKERAVGLGTFGFHSLLQRKGIPFETGGFGSATQVNNIVYSTIQQRANEESQRLAVLRGEPTDCAGSGFRNSHVTAIAPNASSSAFFGASPSIEPWSANLFTSSGRAGNHTIKNKYLEQQLEILGMNTKEVWQSIKENDGSVQHLDIPERVKDTFKTAREIDQRWIIEHAAARQKYIDQSQSVNLFVDSHVTAQTMSDLHMLAWAKGLKSLYYLRAKAAKKADISVGGVATKPIEAPKSLDLDECLSCEG